MGSTAATTAALGAAWYATQDLEGGQALIVRSGSYLDTSRPAGYQDPAFAGQVPQGGPSPAWSQEASPHPQGIGELPIATYSGEIGSQPAQAATVPQVMQVPSSRPERDRDVTGQYTRTLVGPLSANAARLLDDKKQPGIFFTFQDLSVRTEGLSSCSPVFTIITLINYLQVLSACGYD